MNPNIPAVICPKESGVYKVAQFLGQDGTHYLRTDYGMTQPVFQIRIVSEFLKEAGIDKTLTDQVVYPKTDEISIIGTGRVDVSLENKTAVFFGASADYVLMINQEALESLRQSYPDWKIDYNPKRMK